MQTITKIYTIANWCNYTEVESASTSGPTKTEVVSTLMGGHQVTVSTTMREDGMGHEIRTYRVSA